MSFKNIYQAYDKCEVEPYIFYIKKYFLLSVLNFTAFFKWMPLSSDVVRKGKMLILSKIIIYDLVHLFSVSLYPLFIVAAN